MSLAEIDHMEAAEVAEFLEAATIIEARRDLRSLMIAAYSNLKQEAREKLHREIHAEAYPEHEEAVRPIGPIELKGMGLG